jgi:hypothetical protein
VYHKALYGLEIDGCLMQLSRKKKCSKWWEGNYDSLPIIESLLLSTFSRYFNTASLHMKFSMVDSLKCHVVRDKGSEGTQCGLFNEKAHSKGAIKYSLITLLMG